MKRACGPAVALPALGSVAWGGMPMLLILLHPDGRSRRRFGRRGGEETLELFLEIGRAPPLLIDGGRGSARDHSGRAVSGPLRGRRLASFLGQDDRQAAPLTPWEPDPARP